MVVYHQSLPRGTTCIYLCDCARSISLLFKTYYITSVIKPVVNASGKCQGGTYKLLLSGCSAKDALVVLLRQHVAVGYMSPFA